MLFDVVAFDFPCQENI